MILTRELKKISKDISYIDALRDLRNFYAMKINIKSSSVITRTEITEGTKAAIKAVGMAFPKRVLHHESSKILVVEN